MKSSKIWNSLIIIGLGIYIYLAIAFYLPRTLFMDNAYSTFNLIQYQAFALEHNRLSFVLAQIFPLIFIHLKANLQTVLYVISLSSVFFIVLIISRIHFGFKQKNTSLLLLLLITLPLRTFFQYAISESILALCFVIFVQSSLIRFNSKTTLKNKDILMLFILNLIAALFHPSALILIGIVTANLFAQTGFNSTFKKQSIIFFIVACIYYLIKPKGGYDSGLLQNLVYINTVELLQNSFVNYYFKGEFWNVYWIFSVLFVIITVRLILIKSYQKLMIYAAVVVVTYCITAIVYSKGDSNYFMEKNLLPLCFSVIMPLFYHEFDFTQSKSKFFVLYAFLALFLISYSFYHIHKKGLVFRSRNTEIVKIIEELNEKKVQKGILQSNTYHYTREISPWTMPYETLILSNLYFNKSITIIGTEDVEQLESKQAKGNWFLGASFTPALNLDTFRLNQDYFSKLEGQYTKIE